jgi:predicted nuclease of restriction endonuclease-like (RecB) superfamily
MTLSRAHCQLSRHKQTRYKVVFRWYDVSTYLRMTRDEIITVIAMQSPDHTELQSAPGAPLSYELLISSIAEVHARTQAGAAGAVNRYLTLRNWFIGAYVVQFEQNGADRASYGQQLLLHLARDLKKRQIPGCSPEMLGRMRVFYRTYPQLRESDSSPFAREPGAPAAAAEQTEISSPAVTKFEAALPTPLGRQALLRLSWSHLIELIRLDDPWKRAFYENECLRGSWSKRELQRQISSLLYERTGLSLDKQAVIERGRRQASAARVQISELIRDPYVLEFVGLAEQPSYTESDLETALLDHIQGFLLELGSGFCFEARQKRITVGAEHDYIDLVFYHRLLRCHLLIELKVRHFQHSDAGQMNFYLNYWKREITSPEDNPPVGLLLCSDKDQTKVEYAIGGLDQQLFVSRYLVALPTAHEIERLVERDRALWEQRCESGGTQPCAPHQGS